MKRLKLFWIFRYLGLRIRSGIALEGFVKIDPHVRIFIEAGAKLKLGKNVRIKYGTTIYLKSGSQLSIGPDTSIGHSSEISVNRSVDIGRDVITGADFYGADANHSFERSSVPFRQQGMDIQTMQIGDNVWIGRSVMCLAGSSIGDDSVVAAGSIVTKRNPDGVLLAGVPAKVIRRL